MPPNPPSKRVAWIATHHANTATFPKYFGPPPPEMKSHEGPLLFHPTSPFPPHTHNSQTSLLSPHLPPYPPPTHTTPQPFFYPHPFPPHAPNFQPTQCNQEYCSIHMPLCPRVNDQGDMIRGGNSLDRLIIIHLEINDLM